ncbi:MAG: hypothetical protein EXR47_04260 [Dehalococcoidia bacterium]|nr:hypothetical protein [Dehalococcoidia bacterium]
MNRPLPRLLVAAQDPGGANAIAPVARRLLEEGRVELRVAGVRWAAAAFRSWELPPLTLPADLEHLPATWEAMDAAAQLLLDAFPADGLLLGTSWGPSIEKALTRWGFSQGVPAVAVLDAWANYAERFRGPGPEQRMEFLPDRIAIMDDWARREMLALGFPKERLVVTGQPALDLLAGSAGSDEETRRRAEARRQLGVAAGAKVVAFFSQPISALYGSDPSSPAYLGYDEQTVLRDLAQVIGALPQEHSAPFVLLVKPHPKEAAGEMQRYLASTKGASITDPQTSPQALLHAADVVVGMSSILLVESYLMGKPTISYQPGLRLEDPLVLTRAGVLPRADTVDGLRAQLKNALGGAWRTPAPPTWWQPPGEATGRVVGEVYRLLGVSPILIGGHDEHSPRIPSSSPGLPPPAGRSGLDRDLPPVAQ